MLPYMTNNNKIKKLFVVILKDFEMERLPWIIQWTLNAISYIPVKGCHREI